MSLDILPFEPADLVELQLQPAQEAFAGFVPEGYGDWLAKVGPAFSARAQGVLVAVLGVAEEWEGRAQAWAMLGGNVGPHMVALTRAARAYYATAPYRRIEAQTPQDFSEGHRWLRLLGFKPEGAMPRYYPDGRTAIRYARCAP